MSVCAKTPTNEPRTANTCEVTLGQIHRALKNELTKVTLLFQRNELIKVSGSHGLRQGLDSRRCEAGAESEIPNYLLKRSRMATE